MDLGLRGARAIVTGGSRGIGFAVAAALVREGATVVIAARDAGALTTAAAKLGPAAIPLPVDTRDSDAVDAFIRTAHDRLGGLDILVNGAATPSGGSVPPALPDLHDDDLRAEIESKVLGYLRTSRAAAPLMTAGGGGRIVNIIGLAARQAGSAVGSMRNAALVALTKNLADELGPAGIGVVGVHPGLTVTERIPAMIDELARSRELSPADAEALLAADTVLGRLVTAEEIADVVAFLASPRAVAITGDTIPAGGGRRGAIYY